MITLIKFPASFTDKNGNRRTETAEFKLGEGPCGKSVRSLDFHLDNRRDVKIVQECEDGSIQTFHYRDEDIEGRIEVQTAPEPVLVRYTPEFDHRRAVVASALHP